MAHPYGSEYKRIRERLLGKPCVWCGAPSTTADHIPPLSAYPPGEWVGKLHPACRKCNLGNRARRAMKPSAASGGGRGRRRVVFR